MNERIIKLVQELLSGKVVVLTGEELKDVLQKYVITGSNNEGNGGDYSGLPRFITGLKSLAATLKVSLSTVSRWKADGLLDDAVFQNGKTVIFDTYKVLEILRVSNKKMKFNAKN